MSREYFESLNYTLGNEDTTVEFEMVKRLSPKKVFSIGGSGGRSLPLISQNTELLCLADLSSDQISLIQLRRATYQQFDYQDFLLFWGYPPFSEVECRQKRKELFEKLEFGHELKKYFFEKFEFYAWDTILYKGKWEKTFAILAKALRVILGKNFDSLFLFNTLEEQVLFYETKFPKTKWNAILFLLGNKNVFNALLYKGHFIKKNSHLSFYDYYFNAFDRIIRSNLVKKSFFMNLCFYGTLKHIESIPVEAQEEAFGLVKNFQGQILYNIGDMVSLLAKGQHQFNFLSLSDVPSYFEGDIEQNFMQMIRPSLSQGAVVVIRNYLRTPMANLDGYTEITDRFFDLIKNEMVQMYDIRVFEYTGVYSFPIVC